MQISTLNFGIALVYWIDYAFSFHKGSYAWRIPGILQCAFLIPMLLLISILPESPRWLAAHGRVGESLSVLRRLRCNSLEDDAIVRLHEDIVRAVEEESNIMAGAWSTIWKADKIHSRRRLLIACGIQAFQQLGGINAIICKSFGVLPTCNSDDMQTTPARCSRMWASPTTSRPSCLAFCSFGSCWPVSSLGSSLTVLAEDLW